MASPFDAAARLARALEFIIGEIARELTPAERNAFAGTIAREARTSPVLRGVSLPEAGPVNVSLDAGTESEAIPALARAINRFLRESGSGEVWELGRAVVRDAIAQFPAEVEDSGLAQLLLGGAESRTIATGIEGDRALFPRGIPRASPALVVGTQLDELRSLGAHFAAGGLEFGKAVFVTSYGTGQEALRAIAAAGADVETAVAERRLLIVEVSAQPAQAQTRRGQIVIVGPSGVPAAVRGAIAEIGNHAPKRAVIQHPRTPASQADREALLALVDDLRDAGYDVLYQVDSESHRLLPQPAIATRFPVKLEMERKGDAARLRVREARGVELGEREADLRLSPDGTLFIATGLEVGDVRLPGMVGDRVPLRKRGLVNGGMVNGVVNGRGAVNGSGLTNGKSILQKRGLVNGRGLINGGGLTNGRVLRYGSAIEKRVKPKDRSWVVTALAVALVIGGPALMIVFPGDAIVIDGDFSDWAGKNFFNPSSPLIDKFIFYAPKDGSNKLFIYMEGTGSLFGGGNLDANAIYAFFAIGVSDVYNGYQQDGFPVNPSWNAQYMVGITGAGGRVTGAGFFIYSGSGPQDSWSSWEGPYDMKAANYGARLEAQLYAGGPLGLMRAASYSGTIVARNAGITDVSFIASPGLEGALDMKPSYRDVKVVQGAAEVLDVMLVADRHDVSVKEMRFDVVNGSGGPETLTEARLMLDGEEIARATPTGGQFAFLTNFTVPENHQRKVTVEVETAGDSGKTVSLRLAGAVADEAVPTVRLGDLRYWYAGHVPGGLAVDGGFEDWAARNKTADPAGDVQRSALGPTPGGGNSVAATNPNVDVTATGLDRTADTLTFFSQAGEGGVMLGGSVVLGGLVDGVSGGSALPGKPLPFTPLEDRWYFFLDTDSRGDTGFRAGGIGAEMALNVSGSFGRVTSAKLERFEGAGGAEWKWSHAADVREALADSSRLESRATVPGLGSAVRVAVMAVDWEYQFDVASSFILKADDPVVQAPTDVTMNEMCPGSSGSCGNWVELYNSGSGTEDMTGWTIQVFQATPPFSLIGTISLSGSIGSGGYAVFTAGFTIPQNAIYYLNRGGSDQTQTCSTGAGSSCAQTPDGSGVWRSNQTPSQGGPNASEFPFGATAAMAGTALMAPSVSRRMRGRGKRRAHSPLARPFWSSVRSRVLGRV